MRKREIFTDPNPILRKETLKVESFDGELQSLIDDMIFTMKDADGIGLAAPQIGESKKIIVVGYDNKNDESSFPLTVLVNPEIISESKERQFMVEGCLSFPGKELYIKRPEKITVSAFDRWGKSVVIEADNLFSRALQHEIDHINGILMVDQIKSVKTIFIGNGSLGIPTLKMLTSNPQFELQAVYTSRDQISGRKKLLLETPIAEEAANLGLNVTKIDSVKNFKVKDAIEELCPDLIILADYREIIPESIFKIPKLGVLNIHPSVLPKYRGPSPVVSAILNGEKKTGVTIIKINDQIDSGDILAQIETKIKSREDANILKKRLSEIAADLLAELIPYYLAGEISPIKQNDNLASDTPRLTKDQGKLSGNEDSKTVDRMVRALNPWPGVYIIKNNKRINITKVHLTRDNKLIIDLVKPEGKNEMKYTDYLNGYHNELTFDE